jgi:3-dehydroquinate synthase
MTKDSLQISSSFGPYGVDFLESANRYVIEKQNPKSDYVLVADTEVWSKHADKYREWDGLPKYLVQANEETKTLEQVDKLSFWLTSHGCSKTTTILAFGGGVIQDLVTFTSRIFHRGCRWEYHPTTLLSQADSCIGAKCGINVMPHKNQLGVVYAPTRVVINQQLLDTLPDEEFLSGFGEILKLSVTGPGEFYEELKFDLEQFAPSLPRGKVLQDIIRKSLLAKKWIIEEDEHEKDLRRVLNYGHSFGHALETLTENRISHGRAIVFGMDLINFLGVRWGITDETFYHDFKRVLRLYFGATTIPIRLDSQALVDQLRTDKKMAFGQMNFAIPRMPGDIVIVPKSLDGLLVELVDQYILEENVFTTY